MVGGVRIGTSGWQYRDWRGTFYEASVPMSHWLEAYSQTFGTVEANGTFYRLPKKETFENWQARTPSAFEFAVKASRFLTHVRRLPGTEGGGRSFARTRSWAGRQARTDPPPASSHDAVRPWAAQ